ncbi:TetR/AcrR family transcriptional regulator [Actinomadura parmotrematis]|uniref:TetR/AcrR family transcriptional regulator n=1 Tax=Actinomadura parmotrematis TaxID=2864039 RepID=A0ABS7G5U9_9ACTN|nr:TetR/AcrR family transcriptional regulator [Actinomadura parmotrematis]MBW8487254.1 TetR/AcrR family transcriptional regulator [Actinomadura parmotrematis]
MPGTPRERRAPSDVWTRPPAGRRPKLTRDAIVEAAVAIADAEGLDAVSIRRVAAELGVRAMSLYTHIDAKDDLLALMYDRVAGEVLFHGDMPDGWREAFLEIARRERAAGKRHPWMFAVLGLPVSVGPNGLRHGEQSLEAAAKLTTDPRAMLEIVGAVDHYMLGYVVRETARSPEDDTALLRRVAAHGDFARLNAVLDTGLYSQEGYERGVNWLLDGIEREYGA